MLEVPSPVSGGTLPKSGVPRPAPPPDLGKLPGCCRRCPADVETSPHSPPRPPVLGFAPRASPSGVSVCTSSIPRPPPFQAALLGLQKRSGGRDLVGPWTEHQAEMGGEGGCLKKEKRNRPSPLLSLILQSPQFTKEIVPGLKAPGCAHLDLSKSLSSRPDRKLSLKQNF